MLSGNQHCFQRSGDAVGVIERDLGFAVWTQVRKRAVFADRGEALCQTMRQPNGERHQVGSLVACVPEHHSLVAGALRVEFGIDVVFGAGLERLVDAHGNVGRLLVDRHDHCARMSVETFVAVVVANVVHRGANQLGDVDIGRGGDLARNNHQTGGQQ